MFFTLFLRSFILLLELECVVGASVPVVRVGSRAKGDQRCARGFAVLQYTRQCLDPHGNFCYKTLINCKNVLRILQI